MARDWAYGRPPGEVRPRPSQPLPPIRLRRVGVVAVSGVVVVGALGGVAQAFWTADGRGTSPATAGTAIALSTDAPVSLGLLYPTKSVDLQVVVRNSNPFPVLVTSIVPGTPTIPASATTCTTSGVTVSALTLPATPTIAANSTRTFVFSNAAGMGNNSSNGCQNVTFTVPLTINGQST